MSNLPSNTGSARATRLLCRLKSESQAIPFIQPSPIESKSTLCRADLSREDLSGLSLAQYDLGKRIGAGGMGLVFEATHRTLCKNFAIKFIACENTGQPEIESRFLKEVRAVGKLTHPNLIVAVDAGVENGLQYCVMERLDGSDLNTWIDHLGPMPVGAACEVIRQASLGLAHAHAHGLIHRDIKPSNLFLDLCGCVKVLDFGIAASIEDGSRLTTDSQFMGSVDFVAPEQASDARLATPASDVYSLGCTLIYLLSGQPPYPDTTHPSFVSKLKAAAIQSPAWVDRPPSDIPNGLLRILRQAIEKAAETRINSADLLREKITSFADSGALRNWMQASNRSLATEIKTVLGEQTPRRLGSSKWPVKRIMPKHLGLMAAVPASVMLGIFSFPWWPSGATLVPAHDSSRTLGSEKQPTLPPKLYSHGTIPPVEASTLSSVHVPGTAGNAAAFRPATGLNSSHAVYPLGFPSSVLSDQD